MVRVAVNRAVRRHSVDTRLYQINKQLVELPLTLHHDIDGLFDVLTDHHDDWNIYCLENRHPTRPCVESTLHIDLGPFAFNHRGHAGASAIDSMDIRYLLSQKFTFARNTWLILLMQGCALPVVGQKTTASRITADYYVTYRC